MAKNARLARMPILCMLFPIAFRQSDVTDQGVGQRKWFSVHGFADGHRKACESERAADRKKAHVS